MHNSEVTYTPNEGVYNIKNALDEILRTAIATFESYNVELPSRRYWTVGTPVLDCPQLVVSFVQGYLGRPGDQASEPVRCNVPRSIVASVTIAREIPTVGQNGRAPSAEKIQAGAEMAAIDAWVFLSTIEQYDLWNDGFGLGVIATVDVSEPEGGLQAVTMQLTLAVA
jgi:hypothetical protein